MRIILTDFPMAPTVNNSKTLSRWGRTIIKSAIHRAFESEVRAWQIKNNIDLIKCRARIDDVNLGQDECLKVDLYFCFPKDDIFTKTKKAKSPFQKIDRDNRVKPTMDALSKIFAIDDSVFFSGEVMKCYSEDNLKCTIVVITKTKPSSKQEILNSLMSAVS